MRAVAVLLLAPSLSFAGWSFETFQDDNGLDGFRTFHDGVLQYEMAPSYQLNLAVEHRPVDINDNGWLVGNAYVVDIPEFYNAQGWDNLMFILDPSGNMERGLWTGVSHWVNNDGVACAQVGWGMDYYLLQTGGYTGAPGRYEEPLDRCEDGFITETPTAEVPEPRTVLLIAGLWLGAFLLRAANRN